jgi:hypothetical protein
LAGFLTAPSPRSGRGARRTLDTAGHANRHVSATALEKSEPQW